MILSEFFADFINLHTKNNKKYLLIEKTFSYEELMEMKMLPRLTKEDVEHSNEYTYLGSKFKEGDIKFFAWIEKKTVREGMVVYEPSMIVLSEEEFEEFDCVGNHLASSMVPFIRFKEKNF
jgi:hypothetical protein